MVTKTKTPGIPKKSLINRAEVKTTTMFPKVPQMYENRVLIYKKKPEEKTLSGLYIPSSAITEENKGYVVAVGPLVGRTSLLPVGEINTFIPKVGDFVEFGQYAGVELDYEGEKFLIVREGDIQCKL